MGIPPEELPYLKLPHYTVSRGGEGGREGGKEGGREGGKTLIFMGVMLIFMEELPYLKLTHHMVGREGVREGGKEGRYGCVHVPVAQSPLLPSLPPSLP